MQLDSDRQEVIGEGSCYRRHIGQAVLPGGRRDQLDGLSPP